MDKNTAFQMYQLFRSEVYGQLNLHRETLQNYLAFSVAVLGATIGGTLQLSPVDWKGTIILFVGSILNVFICIIAIRMCDRFYLGALERVAITAKLETILGLTDGKTRKVYKDKVNPFPSDNYLLPERWVTGRDFATTEEYVKKYQNAGVNRLAKITFRVLIIVNILLAAGSLAVLIF